MLYGWFNFYHFCGLIIFSVAAITDALDGYIARKRGLITDFGKLMDPLADKLLTIAAFVALLGMQRILHPLYNIFLILIISREFVVTSIRLVAAEKGVIIAADKWGKLKTILQMVWIIYALILRTLHIDVQPRFTFAPYIPFISDIFRGDYFAAFITLLHHGLLCLVIIVTVGSGVNYCIKSRKLFRDM